MLTSSTVYLPHW
uniref:Uncharacterized protein n=1 Tax=Anguilla anguilla TaxID=7936 RepID=A0A0E9R981_ANGAN